MKAMKEKSRVVVDEKPRTFVEAAQAGKFANINSKGGYKEI
jgi:hypothetical protein